jgi:hypothetical protein
VPVAVRMRSLLVGEPVGLTITFAVAKARHEDENHEKEGAGPDGDLLDCLVATIGLTRPIRRTPPIDSYTSVGQYTYSTVGPARTVLLPRLRDNGRSRCDVQLTVASPVLEE